MAERLDGFSVGTYSMELEVGFTCHLKSAQFAPVLLTQKLIKITKNYNEQFTFVYKIEMFRLI